MNVLLAVFRLASDEMAPRRRRMDGFDIVLSPLREKGDELDVVILRLIDAIGCYEDAANWLRTEDSQLAKSSQLPARSAKAMGKLRDDLFCKVRNRVAIDITISFISGLRSALTDNPNSVLQHLDTFLCDDDLLPMMNIGHRVVNTLKRIGVSQETINEAYLYYNMKSVADVEQ